MATPATPVREIPFTIKSMQDARKDRFLKLLIYGAFGVGKTTLAASASEVPKMQDTLLLNCEAGDLSIAESNMDVISANNFPVAARVYEYLKRHCQLRDDGDVDSLKQLQSRLTGVPIEEIVEPKRYRTVIVDSLSELETFSMYSILGITDATALDQETAVAEWADFRRNFNAIQRLVRAFRDLPMHVIFTCAQQYQQDEVKHMLYMPLLTGKLSSQIQGFVDVVGYLLVQNVEGVVVRRLYVQPIGRFDAKCRFPKFKDPYFENPTIVNMLKAVGLSN